MEITSQSFLITNTPNLICIQPPLQGQAGFRPLVSEGGASGFPPYSADLSGVGTKGRRRAKGYESLYKPDSTVSWHPVLRAWQIPKAHSSSYELLQWVPRRSHYRKQRCQAPQALEYGIYFQTLAPGGPAYQTEPKQTHCRHLWCTDHNPLASLGSSKVAGAASRDAKDQRYNQPAPGHLRFRSPTAQHPPAAQPQNCCSKEPCPHPTRWE